MRADEWRLKISENVQSVLAKLSRASDRAAGRFDRLNARVGRAANFTGRAIGGVMNMGMGAVEGIASSLVRALPLPGKMGASLARMAGPAGVAASAVLALGGAMFKGVQAAEQYAAPFRDFRNLNLDRPQRELDAVNDRVLELSGGKGLDPTKLLTGFTAAQRITGDFGPDMQDMVARVGEASRALNMDFDRALKDSAETMRQFGMPLLQVDDLLSSNVKAANAARFGYDEMGRAQQAFAGAAAHANQGVDSANKVFAALSVNTRDAGKAADLTRASFEAIGDKSVEKAFKKLGVDVRDANGNIRQTDRIMRELKPRFAEMNDKAFERMKGDIGGNDGLLALMDAMKYKGDEVIGMLDGFDRSHLGINDVLERADKDIDIINEKIDGKLKASWLRLGQAVMPMWVEIKTGAASAIDSIADYAEKLFDPDKWQMRQMVDTAYERLNASAGALEGKSLEEQERIVSAYRAKVDDGQRRHDRATESGYEWKETWKASQAAMNKFVTEQEQRLRKLGVGADKEGGAVPGTSKDRYAGFKGDDVKKGVESVVGGGKQVRNVNIRIDSLVKELTIRSQSVREGANEVKRTVEEALVRAVQGTELTIAND